MASTTSETTTTAAIVKPVYKVIATDDGLYGGHRSRGAAFTLKKAADYSARWMKAIGWTPSGEASAS
jgi:hypothetical protein